MVEAVRRNISLKLFLVIYDIIIAIITVQISSFKVKLHKKTSQLCYKKKMRPKITDRERMLLLAWAPQLDVEELKAGPTKPTALQMSTEDLKYRESIKDNKSIYW